MDQDIREQSLLPTQSFIVEAPAGSGKTELLTRRFLSLLAHVERDPEEIVALTFTRKAASEMKQRIILALKQAKNQQNTEAKAVQLAEKALIRDKKSNWQLIENPNRLRVMTIDALCMMLAHRTPILSHFGGKPDVHPYPLFLYQKAAKHLIEQTKPEDSWYSAFRHLLLAFDHQLEKLAKLFVQLLTKRDQWLGYLFNDEIQSGLFEYFENNISELKTYQSNFMAHRVELQASDIISLLNTLAQNLNMNISFEQSIQSFNQPEFWQLWIDVFFTKEGKWRKSVTKKQGFLSPSAAKDKDEKASRQVLKEKFLSLLEELQAIDGLEALVNEYRELPDVPLLADECAHLHSLTNLLPALVAHLKLVFKETGTVDFIEMNIGALEALENEQGPTETALYLDYRISHLLVDEFQDTSSIQFKLLECLVKEWLPKEGKTIFCVGDPMQSIYRFRGAEVGVFLQAQQSGIAQIPLTNLSLKQNFRTSENLVAWTNEAFSQILPPEDDLTNGAIAFRQAIATKPASDLPGIHFNAFNSAMQQAADLIAYIQKYQQHQPEASIAVLVRARRQLMDIIPFLQDAEIPFVAKEISKLSTRPHVLDCLALAKAITNWDDRIAWFSILRAPWIGLTLKDIFIIANSSPCEFVWNVLADYQSCKGLSAYAESRLAHVVPVIARFINNRNRTGFSQWLKGLWTALGANACYHATALTDIDEIFERLNVLSKETDTIDIEQLSEILDSQYVDQTFNGPKQATAQVQLMTIHQSKGLEFDVVILPELHANTKPRDLEILNWHEMRVQDNAFYLLGAKTPDRDKTLYAYINHILKQKELNEFNRLFYVAITRAKQQLYLSYWSDSDDGPQRKSNFLSLLHQAGLEADKVQDRQLGLAPIQNRGLIDSEHFKRLPLNWSLADNLTALLPSTIEATTELNWPEKGAEWLRIAGIVFHQVIAHYLQNAARQLALGDCQALAVKVLQTHYLSPEHTQLASKLIHHALRNSFDDKVGRWILNPAHKERWSEKAFMVKSKHTLQQMVIDYTFVDEQNIRWIIDFKINTAQTPDQLDMDYEIKTYQKQLERYRYTLSQVENREIRCALYFPVAKAWWELPQRMIYETQ